MPSLLLATISQLAGWFHNNVIFRCTIRFDQRGKLDQLGIEMGILNKKIGHFGFSPVSTHPSIFPSRGMECELYLQKPDTKKKAPPVIKLAELRLAYCRATQKTT